MWRQREVRNGSCDSKESPTLTRGKGRKEAQCAGNFLIPRVPSAGASGSGSSAPGYMAFALFSPVVEGCSQPPSLPMGEAKCSGSERAGKG